MEDTKANIKELCEYTYYVNVSNGGIWWDKTKINIFKDKYKLLSEEQQIYLIKYLITKNKLCNGYSDDIFSCFLDNKNIISEILELYVNITIDGFTNLNIGPLLRNKKVPLDKSTYNKLLKICSEHRLFKTYTIITEYECEDMLFNTEIEDINDNNKDKDKDKEIERLKLEIEEIKKFYINS